MSSTVEKELKKSNREPRIEKKSSIARLKYNSEPKIEQNNIL